MSWWFTRRERGRKKVFIAGGGMAGLLTLFLLQLVALLLGGLIMALW